MSLLLLLGPHGPLFWWVHAISVALNSINIVSSVRLSEDVHHHQSELSRLCIDFLVAECIVAHGPEMRFVCLSFLLRQKV